MYDVYLSSYQPADPSAVHVIFVPTEPAGASSSHPEAGRERALPYPGRAKARRSDVLLIQLNSVQAGVVEETPDAKTIGFYHALKWRSAVTSRSPAETGAGSLSRDGEVAESSPYGWPLDS